MLQQFHRRDKILITVLFALAVLAIGVSWYGGQRLERALLINDATTEAVRWARYLEQNFGDLNNVLRNGTLTHEDEAVIDTATQAGGVFRYKFFDPNGVIVHASRPEDFGKTNTKPYFFEIVRQGGTYTKLEEEETFGSARSIVSEAYVPFMEGGRFRGAIEVYVDATGRAKLLKGYIRYAEWGLLALLAVVAIACGLVIRHNIRDRNRDYYAVVEANEALERAEAELRDLNDGLERRVEERAGELRQKNNELNAANQQVVAALEEIKELNAKLRKSNTALEDRVNERTQELIKVNEQLMRVTERLGNARPLEVAADG